MKMKHAMAILLVWVMLAAQIGAAGSASGTVFESSTPSASRDPFAPVYAVADGREVSPLERFTLAELRLVATVAGVDPPRALIEDPAGVGFIITPGAIVGAEQGKVISIGAGRIVVETSQRDPARNRQIVLFAGQSGKRKRL